MQALLTSSQMKAADRFAIETVGVDELVLMEHAALGVLRALERRFGSLLTDTVGAIYAGPGNNGGDALAVARLLSQKGVKSFCVTLLGKRDSLSQSCSQQLGCLQKLGVKVSSSLPSQEVDWIIDGLFGTGLTRGLEGDFANAVMAINARRETAWVVSIDLPSGLSSDTGYPLKEAVFASETVTLGFYKRGLVTGIAADHTGRLSLETIQIPRTIPTLKVDAYLFEEADAKKLPPRRDAAHKGNFGHVYVTLGQEDKTGASLLSAMAALRTGAGLCTLVGKKPDFDKARLRFPLEVMSKTEEAYLASPAGVLVVGPGMGTTPDRWEWLKKVLAKEIPLVLDADALTLFSDNLKQAEKLLSSRKATTVLTPHPKEAARLLGTTTEAIEKDRFKSASELAEAFSAWVILKGKGTLIAQERHPTIVTRTGNSSLAKGGSGDVLSGTVASLLAQKVPPETALPLATYLHGRAAELASEAQGTERSLLSSELTEFLAPAFKELES